MIYDELSNNLALSWGRVHGLAVVMVTLFSDGDFAVENSAGASVVDASTSCMVALSSGMSSTIVVSNDKVSLL
jgi:hypothetical protein